MTNQKLNMNIPVINKNSKKGDRVLTTDRLGRQRETMLRSTPLFNEEGQLVGWSSKS